MAENVISHFCHEHPLILTKNVGNKGILLCYGCRKRVISELAYMCTQQYCPSKFTLHKRCAELPKQISHSSHPTHSLNLFDFRKGKYWMWRCHFCRVEIEDVLGYSCGLCNFSFDISCPLVGSISDLLEKKTLQHPSHHHPLTLMRSPAPLSFNCDACGTDDSDMAYICSICEFWIHETCATLPHTLETSRHHHQLSLAFTLPNEFRVCYNNCDVCLKVLPVTRWVYCCNVCRYFSHIKCATQIETTTEIILAESSSNLNDDLIQLPIDDFSKKLITPFIMRSRKNDGLDKIPDIKDMPTSITMPATTTSFSILFNHHKHPLSLVLEEPTVNHVDESSMVMICDVCVTPVYSPPYYNCPTCNNYFVHSTCYLLPEKLSCPDLLQLYCDCPILINRNHKFSLYTGSELDNMYSVKCKLCQFDCNGRVYGCEICNLVIDVKCAALPTTIKHASHQHHKLMMKRVEPDQIGWMLCNACGELLKKDYPVAFYCTSNGCNFVLDMRCVMLQASIQHEWDKHPLLLMYDASADHPTDFYCEVCEEEMNPKKWMYHCRECDRSFHTECLQTFRNFKCGRQVQFDYHRVHPHLLTLKPNALKLRCDVCGKDWYKKAGFECALCNYVMCYSCGVIELHKM